jgi:hypothetical protein
MRATIARTAGLRAPAGRLPRVSTPQKATLKPYLGEIREWVEQGRTDVWIAHTLNSTPASISAFRSTHGILRRDIASEARTAGAPPVIPPDAPPEEEPTKRRRRPKKSDGAPPLSAPAPAAEGAAAAAVAVSGAEDAPGKRRRRRGGRGRKRPAGYEAVLDHGEEGYGFWLDGAVRDDPVFGEHWADVRALVVRIEADQIVIRADDRA